jgi:hypothetical protein
MQRLDPAAPSFDIFVLSLLSDRDEFVDGLVSNLERRGYSIAFPYLSELSRELRRLILERALSKAKLNVVILGPAFASQIWSEFETRLLDQSDLLPIWHGTPPPMVEGDCRANSLILNSSYGAATVASGIARACGWPSLGRHASGSAAELCWRCGATNTSGAAECRDCQSASVQFDRSPLRATFGDTGPRPFPEAVGVFDDDENSA